MELLLGQLVEVAVGELETRSDLVLEVVVDIVGIPDLYIILLLEV